jgi:hypothetical protein
VFALGKRLIFSRYEALINPNTKANELNAQVVIVLKVCGVSYITRHPQR